MSQLRIAHLSDPHFGTVSPGVKAALLATLAEVKPDLVLLTGDITQRARRSEFQAAKEFSHEIKPVPFIAVPGNHDIPLLNILGRFWNPYAGFRRFFKERLEKDFFYGDVVVTGLNSTSRWRHIQGDFNLKRLESRLIEKKNQAKVHIVAFHHPMDCAKYIDEKNLLKQRDASLRIFEQYGIDLIVGGHIHDPYVSLSKVRYPESQRSIILSVAGTCLSDRTREGAPNSFNLIDVRTEETATISIGRHDFNGEKFLLVSSKTFNRTPPGDWQSR